VQDKILSAGGDPARPAPGYREEPHGYYVGAPQQ